SRITMMSFLALNMQVAEASVAMHEMPITTTAKEVAILQATAFPFWNTCASGKPNDQPGLWRATTAYLPQQIAAELIERRFPFAALSCVRFWHEADMSRQVAHLRLRSTSGKATSGVTVSI